jgi:hypothetical protein
MDGAMIGLCLLMACTREVEDNYCRSLLAGDAVALNLSTQHQSQSIAR